MKSAYKDFALNDSDTFSGVIPIIHKISDRQIAAVTEEYRKICPEDKRTDGELRVPVINQILRNRRINA